KGFDVRKPKALCSTRHHEGIGFRVNRVVETRPCQKRMTLYNAVAFHCVELRENPFSASRAHPRMDNTVSILHPRIRAHDHESGVAVTSNYRLERLDDLEASFPLEIRAHEEEREVLAVGPLDRRRRWKTWIHNIEFGWIGAPSNVDVPSPS